MTEQSSGLKTLTSKINNIEFAINTILSNPITQDIENAVPSILSHFNNVVQDAKTQVTKNKINTKQSSINVVENSIQTFITSLKTKFGTINFVNIFQVIEEIIMFVEDNKTIILQYANLADNIVNALNPSQVKLSIALDICNQVIEMDEQILIPMINYAVSKIFPNNKSLILKPKKKGIIGTLKSKLT